MIVDQNSHIVYKKFEIFRILTDEINILVKTFQRDKIIDESLLENICRLFIETQNVLAKINSNIKSSYYMLENFNIKNEVNISK